MTLYFPADGGFIFFVQGVAAPKSPTAFKSTFPFQLIQVPVLGPLEDPEPLVQDATLKRGLALLVLQDTFVIIGIEIWIRFRDLRI